LGTGRAKVLHYDDGLDFDADRLLWYALGPRLC
jgi:hypothetical protein